MPATYLVRFDDLCPTMNWTVWSQVERILVEANVKPILAVVPDNCDRELKVEPARADFWAQVRGWQSRGWTIGLHGYQHRYETDDAGLIGRNRYSEFAGLPSQMQHSKLRKAVAIFEREGVVPDVWVAPAHSFDRATLDALAVLGLRRISDGYGLRPYLDARGMLWVPQQIGRFRALPGGVWTVCLHHNGWGAREIDGFRAQIERFRTRIASFAEVVERYSGRRAGVADLLSTNTIRMARSLRMAAGVAR